MSKKTEQSPFKGMRTAVSDNPMEPQPANAELVEVARQTQGDDSVSTTEKLFGDLMEGANPGLEIVKPISQSPEEEPKEEPKPEPEKPKEEPKPEPEPQPEPKQESPQTEDEILDFDAFANKRVKAKVDGVEETVTFKELRDQYQLKKHLAMAADKVGEERRRLAEEKRQFVEQQQRHFDGQARPESNQMAAPSLQTQVDPNLYSVVQSLQQKVMEMEWEKNVRNVDRELKSEGFDDFAAYLPKIQAHLATLPPELAAAYDTIPGAKTLYKALKLEELKSAPPPRPIQQPVPAPKEPPRPPITKIDGGGQPSSANVDDSRFQYRSAFQRATKTGDKEDWNRILSMKGLIPEN